MKTIKEMLADVRADLAQRQQNDLENEKEKIRRQQAVAAAEKDMQDALAHSDQEAYHAAEGRLTYARAHLQAFEAVNVWWTTEEADAIEQEVYHKYCRESVEKHKEAYKLLLQVEELLGDAFKVAGKARTIFAMIEEHTKVSCSYGIPATRETLPHDFATDLARKAGTYYAPKSMWG